MDKFSGQKRTGATLYPPIDPYDQRMLDVGDGHSVYVEQCGNPNGLPVVVLHGGPGGGCSPAMRRYFDPEVFRIVLFDQRGCGRSRPHASVDDNTTWHLVRDIELIRRTLCIEQWYVFGGSWGATLALIYAQEHPERVLGLVLRGVFLMTQPELDWFYAGGAGHFWPEVWERFVAPIPENERGDLIGAYHQRLFCGDKVIETRYARTWSAWENALASVNSDGRSPEGPAEYSRAFARLECHYFQNKGFLNHETQILSRLDRLSGIPGYVVQGRFDMICPPVSAYRLVSGWRGAQAKMVPHAGHALSEPGISAELIRIMNQIGRQARS
ncbi:MAG: prolyl aminopeptidase [Marivivens sp.]|nr:prolyl aminopeptidase [Marivivens sp.]